MDEVKRLTDINEIIEYLTSIGISCKYIFPSHKRALIHIELKSEYLNCEYDVEFIIRHYERFYNSQKCSKLLNNLLSCSISSNYVDYINCNVHVWCQIGGDGNIVINVNFNDDTVGVFKDINDLMEFMNKNYPEWVRPVDIKIALK
jgi:hypothetical protein